MGDRTMIDNNSRDVIISALRRGVVPTCGIGQLAVGLEGFRDALSDELRTVSNGGGVVKAVRGEYGEGKTFMTSWVGELAMTRSFASTHIMISDDVPLYKPASIYREIISKLRTAECESGTLRSILNEWIFQLETAASNQIDDDDEAKILDITERAIAEKMSVISDLAPGFATALKHYRSALAKGDNESCDAMISWLSGDRSIAAHVKRAAGIRGDIDETSAFGALRGLLVVLRESGYKGLYLVLDEAETIQAKNSTLRTRSYQSLRKLVDEICDNSFEGLYLMITGTKAFFEGRKGISQLEPLEQRLSVEFRDSREFDNPRAVQVRLPEFDSGMLIEACRRVMAIYIIGCSNAERIQSKVTDEVLGLIVENNVQRKGMDSILEPRLLLKYFIESVLDMVDQFEAFDPTSTLSDNPNEAGKGVVDANEIEIDV